MDRHRTGHRLYVRVECRDSTVTLQMEGRLTVEEDVRQLPGLARSMGRLEGILVLLNFEGVRQLDCAGLGQLVAFGREVQTRGGYCALVNVDPRQRRLVQLARLTVVLPVFASGQEAHLWFRGSGRTRATPACVVAGWTHRFPVSVAADRAERRLARSGDHP